MYDSGAEIAMLLPRKNYSVIASPTNMALHANNSGTECHCQVEKCYENFCFFQGSGGGASLQRCCHRKVSGVYAIFGI
jgi:hypothetical protein